MYINVIIIIIIVFSAISNHAQRAMEHARLGLILRGKVQNREIKRVTREIDAKVNQY